MSDEERTVFVVERSIYGMDMEIRAIYSTREGAEAWIANHDGPLPQATWDYDIEEWTLDPPVERPQEDA
uniref:DUF7336 domain-containing protein n=1 Tax=viral metagenome TaxID=1070528 RepID=A0A6M3JKM4_9ZZZZ